MGFLSQLQLESGTEVTFVKSRNVSVAFTDIYLVIVVTCFRDNGTDKEGGHQLRRYDDTRRSFFLERYIPYIPCIRMFVEVCCAEKPGICSLGISAAWTPYEKSKTSSMEDYIPSLKEISACVFKIV